MFLLKLITWQQQRLAAGLLWLSYLSWVSFNIIVQNLLAFKSVLMFVWEVHELLSPSPHPLEPHRPYGFLICSQPGWSSELLVAIGIKLTLSYSLSMDYCFLISWQNKGESLLQICTEPMWAWGTPKPQQFCHVTHTFVWEQFSLCMFVRLWSLWNKNSSTSLECNSPLKDRSVFQGSE